MFNIGDKVVYPLQGIGTIVDIVEKDFDGSLQQYYTIKMLHNSMDIMIPASRVDILHIRSLSDTDIIDSVLKECTSRNYLSESNIRLRVRDRINVNTEKIKSGNLKECVEVIHDLSLLNNEKPLNLNEKQLLRKAKTSVVDEISLVKNLNIETASSMLQHCFS